MEFVDKKNFKLLYSQAGQTTSDQSTPKPEFYDRLK